MDFELASRGRTLLWELSELVAVDFYGYDPSTALACIAMVLFFCAAVAVAWRTEKSKWRYMHTVTITGLIEAAGYAAMLAAIQLSGKTNIYGAYVANQVFVILSPNLLQAADYWTLGNLLAASPNLTHGRRLLSRAAITITFAGADLIALVIQAVGISIWATAKSDPEGSPDQVSLGSDIMLGGLAFQLFAFCIFTVLAIWVHKHPQNILHGTSSLRSLFTGLYINIAFLLVRNIYRFVEFTQTTVIGYPPPPGTYIMSDKEVLFYTLDTLPILLCFAAFIIWHPGFHLPPLPGKGQPEAQFIDNTKHSMSEGSPGAAPAAHKSPLQAVLV